MPYGSFSMQHGSFELSDSQTRARKKKRKERKRKRKEKKRKKKKGKEKREKKKKGKGKEKKKEEKERKKSSYSIKEVSTVFNGENVPFIFDVQTSCFHLDADPSPGDRLKQDAHIPHMSHVQRPI